MNAEKGQVRWSPVKSVWITLIAVTGTALAPFTFSWEAFTVFAIFSAIVLCCGHSVGLHRCVIHRSFDCPQWLENLLVYLGTLVGIAGPFGMIRQHDLRDWAQRQSVCHDYLCHRQPLLRDGWWQLHCQLELDHPPEFQLESRLSNNRFYQWLERTWMWHQLPYVLLFGYLGGIGWIVWGVCLRIAVCVVGHWFVNYLAHNTGKRPWRITGASVQGYNVAILGMLSFGEGWHNNHHAFPRSARHGHNWTQPDPGWWFIWLLAQVGLASHILEPSTLPERPERTAGPDYPKDSTADCRTSPASGT
jgi:stearoyl-CoA desaturase (delta-9 desaturase)